MRVLNLHHLLPAFIRTCAESCVLTHETLIGTHKAEPQISAYMAVCAEQISRGVSGNGMRSGDCPLTMRIEVKLSGFGLPSVRLDLSHSGLGVYSACAHPFCACVRARHGQCCQNVCDLAVAQPL